MASTSGEYKPSFMYEDVWTGMKYPATNPVPKLMQNSNQGKTKMIPNSDSNVVSASASYSRVFEDYNFLCRATSNNFNLNVSPPIVVEDHDDDDLPRGTYNRNSSQTMATVAKVVQRRQIRRRIKPGSTRFLFDRRSNGYHWLPSGWLAEERIMETGRVYRYYYDADGGFYYSKFEVLTTLARLRKNIVVEL